MSISESLSKKRGAPSIPVTVRFRAEDVATIRAAADAAGVDVSTWIRRACAIAGGAA